MKVKYANHQTWYKNVTDDPLSEFSKNNRNRIKSTLTKLSETTISHKIEPLTQETVDWFTPLYNETIGGKDNPNLYDIYGTTLGKESEFEYFSLIVFENETPIGATIFSQKKAFLSVAYRIYPHQWEQHKLQASPSLYAEYALNQRALECGYSRVCLGKDRNPYGVNSHIGLAVYKLSVGSVAYVTKLEHEINEIDLEDINQDALILLHPKDGTRITNAILYTSESTLEKYIQSTKYPDQLSVEIVLRPN